MKLFGVENVKSYQKGTAHFKRRVLDVAIEEINEHTELEVWYTEKRVGNKITGFVLHWSTGKKVNAATEKQLSYCVKYMMKSRKICLITYHLKVLATSAKQDVTSSPLKR